MELNKNIYKLELHECVRQYAPNIPSFFIQRVPGGWIYQFDDNRVFVPYNNEFLKKEKN